MHMSPPCNLHRWAQSSVLHFFLQIEFIFHISQSSSWHLCGQPGNNSKRIFDTTILFIGFLCNILNAEVSQFFSRFLQAFKLLYPLFSSYNILANKRNVYISWHRSTWFMWSKILKTYNLANYSKIRIFGAKQLQYGSGKLWPKEGILQFFQGLPRSAVVM